MSVCKHCGCLGGYHYFGCIVSRRGSELHRPQYAPTPAPAPQFRIEWCGGVQVHVPLPVPVKPVGR